MINQPDYACHSTTITTVFSFRGFAYRYVLPLLPSVSVRLQFNSPFLAELREVSVTTALAPMSARITSARVARFCPCPSANEKYSVSHALAAIAIPLVKKHQTVMYKRLQSRRHNCSLCRTTDRSRIARIA